MSLNVNPVLSVVVPVYNAGNRIQHWVKEAIASLKTIPEGAELILVNDASVDNTWPLLAEMHANSGGSFRCLNLVGNKGQYAATIVGLQKARGQYLLTIDDDFNPPPSFIAPFFESGKHVSLSYGSFEKPAYGTLRRLGSRAVHRLIQRTTGRRLAASGSSFRLIKSGLWQATRYRLYLPEHLDIELIKACGKEPLFYKVSSTAVHKSKYSNLKLIKLFLRMNRTYGHDTMSLMRSLLDGSIIVNEF
ncbi:MAG: glycosyltransferase [Chitinophagales bacterium]